ncbi:MAG: ribbon-helix-helix domain-containing protein [Candidatus Freyrarchaeum guaymaensis]
MVSRCFPSRIGADSDVVFFLLVIHFGLVLLMAFRWFIGIFLPSVKVSLSLPEELLKMVDKAAGENRMSRSEFVTRILEKALKSEEEVRRYLTVLWKLQKSGYLKLRSPRYPGRRIGRWVVEDTEE